MELIDLRAPTSCFLLVSSCGADEMQPSQPPEHSLHSYWALFTLILSTLHPQMYEDKQYKGQNLLTSSTDFYHSLLRIRSYRCAVWQYSCLPCTIAIWILFLSVLPSVLFLLHHLHLLLSPFRDLYLPFGMPFQLGVWKIPSVANQCLFCFSLCSTFKLSHFGMGCMRWAIHRSTNVWY